MTAKRNNPKTKTKTAGKKSFGRINGLALVAASFLVSANLGLFDPFEIFISNPSEFKLTFAELLPVLIGLCVLLTAVLTLLGLVIPNRHRHRVTAVLLAVGVLLFIQGGFLRWGYGEFTGVPIDWGGFTWQGWFDGAIWFLGLFAAFYFSKRISRNAMFIATALILIQSGIMAARTIAKPDEAPESPSDQVSKKRITPSDIIPQALCRISKSRNVFHFIFDAFQTDVFMELVEEEGISEMLDGFVAYPENISTASQTVLSVPTVFSADVYDGTKTESEYFKEAMTDGFPSLLYRSGYIVNLLPHVSMKKVLYTNYFLRKGTYAAPRWARVIQASTHLVDVSMFRQFPHFVKRLVYNNQNWRLSGVIGDPPGHTSFHHKAMFRDYMNRLEAVHHKPAYHFMHLMPPHPPFVTLRDGSYAGEALPNTRENFKNEARYVLRLFMDFIQKLKDMNLYDSSIILAQGDHGTILTAGTGASEFEKRTNAVTAMLLLKPAGARGGLKFSGAQTSLNDIPATLLDLLGVAHSYSGESIVNIDPSLNRDRQVTVATEREKTETVLRRWVVNGSVRDTTSWRELPTRIVEHKVGRYEWGKFVSFGMDGTGESYLTSGWSTTAATYTWNNGKKAELTFGIEKPERNVDVRIVFFPYIVEGKIDKQKILLSINGQNAGESVCDKPGAVMIRKNVPWQLLQDGRMVISFSFPDAVSPLSIGDGRDGRVFAMKLYKFDAKLVPPENSIKK